MIYTIEGRNQSGEVKFLMKLEFESEEKAKQFIRDGWDSGFYSHLFSVCLSQGDRPISQTIKNATV